MSSYVNFYIKNNKKNVYTYLFGYSRSSKTYEVFYETMGNNHNKEGYCNELTKEDLSYIINHINSEINTYKERCNEREQFNIQVGSWNNSIDEKLELINEGFEMIDFYKEEIEALTRAKVEYSLLLEIIDFNPDKAQLFAGIDCYVNKNEEDECENI